MKLRERTKLFLTSPLKIKPCYPELADIITRRCKRLNPEFEEQLRNNPRGTVSQDVEREIEFGWTYLDEAFLDRGCISFLPDEWQNEVRRLKRINEFVKVPVSFPLPKLNPNEQQTEILEAVRHYRKNDLRPAGNYLMVASTAVGKTILQALVARYFRQRTLVLCPTTLILKSWEADLIKLFNFTSKEIGLIKQKNWKIGKHFTLASPATLHRRQDQWEELYKLFGTVVVDEADGVSAQSVYRFLKECPASYLIGATATATDRVGNENSYLTALFGTPVVSINTYGKETSNSISISQVKVIKTAFTYNKARDSIDWNQFTEALGLDEDRNKLIVSNVCKEWEDGRVVLVVTQRREHAQILEEMLLASGVTNVNQINGSTNTNRVYTKRLLHGIHKRMTTCIVATMSAIKTGANIPNFDSLHITMPTASTKNLEQLIGRIRRRSEGKANAIVTYYRDSLCSYAEHLFNKVIVPTFRRMKIPGFNYY